MNNLIPDIIKAIKKINDEKAYLKDELKKASTKDELNLLQKQFNDLSFNAQRVVLEDFKTVDLNTLFSNDLKAFFDSIPKPKDGLNGKDGKNGLDAVVDYESLNKYLNDKVADIKIPEAEKVNYDLIKSTINELVNQFTLTVKNGIDGKNGADGVGIQDIKDNKGYFEIILSNGTKKKINKPLDGINRHGGGFAVNGGSSEGDMLKSIYDTNSNGIVDNAEKVNNLTVETAVPIDAVFTDTVYDDTALSDRVSDLENSDFVIDANYVHTDNNFTDTLKNKLDGIAENAEVNVKSDWNATTGDAEILNKPTTLLGYGITDVYSKSEIDIIIGDINSALDTINGETI